MKHQMKMMLVVLCTLIPFTSYGWNAVGHMVVANIAYDHLKPDVRIKVDKLVGFLHQEYNEMDSFVKIAFWPDTLRGQKIENYTHWHYIDMAFSLDGTPLKNLIDTDNAVWAVDKMVQVVKNTNANPYERARFLSFLVHIVGDLHQPLHTVSLISAKHPNGDAGGNLYTVRYNNEKSNLHRIWDEGAGLFAGQASDVTTLSQAITARFPNSYFDKKAMDLNTEDWLREEMVIAKQQVYNTPENQNVSQDYIVQGKNTCEEQAALAGYRLAALLNILFV